MTAVKETTLKFEEVATVMEDEFITQTKCDSVCATYFEDITTDEVMRAIEASGTLDFWNDPEEDVYSEEDGDPV